MNVILMGVRVTKFEGKFLPSGKEVKEVNFVMDSSEFDKDTKKSLPLWLKSGIWEGKTTGEFPWYAREGAGQLKKGMTVNLSGSLNLRKYDGGAALEFKIDTVQIVNWGKDDSETPAPSKPSVSISDHGDDESDEVDPFAEEG